MGDHRASKRLSWGLSLARLILKPRFSSASLYFLPITSRVPHSQAAAMNAHGSEILLQGPQLPFLQVQNHISAEATLPPAISSQ